MEPEVSRIIGSNARELPKGTRRTPNPKAAKKKGGLEEDWGVASPGLPGELPRATRPPPRSEADDGQPRIRTGAHGVAMVRELHLVRSPCPQCLARSACSTHDPRASSSSSSSWSLHAWLLTEPLAPTCVHPYSRMTDLRTATEGGRPRHVRAHSLEIGLLPGMHPSMRTIHSAPTHPQARVAGNLISASLYFAPHVGAVAAVAGVMDQVFLMLAIEVGPHVLSLQLKALARCAATLHSFTLRNPPATMPILARPSSAAQIANRPKMDK